MSKETIMRAGFYFEEESDETREERMGCAEMVFWQNGALEVWRDGDAVLGRFSDDSVVMLHHGLESKVIRSPEDWRGGCGAGDLHQVD